MRPYRPVVTGVVAASPARSGPGVEIAVCDGEEIADAASGTDADPGLQP